MGKTFEAIAYDALLTELPHAIELRHQLHQRPGKGGDEAETITVLSEALSGTTLVRSIDGLFASVGDVGGPSIGIRAELDALSVQEESGVPWASEIDGVAHLCGHDVHMAALVAVLRTIASVDGAGLGLVGVFQPREETSPSGAKDLLDAGDLLQLGIGGMLAMHVQPALPDGVVSVYPGVVNAAADSFSVHVRGSAAHGAYPHFSHDPIVAAASLVLNLQTIVARRINPMQPSVVTVGTIRAGSSENAIPESAMVHGTIRSFTVEDRERIHAELRRVAVGTASGLGCRADVEIVPGEPVLRNDEDLAEIVREALLAAGYTNGQEFRSCGADDFSYYGEYFPSLMVFMGVGPGTPDSPGLHHPAFVPDDGAVGQVARAMLAAYLSIRERWVSRGRQRATIEGIDEVGERA